MSKDSLNKWSIQQFNIEPFEFLSKNLGNIQKAYFIEHDTDNLPLRNQRKQPAILFQTPTSIFFQQKDTYQDIRAVKGTNLEESELLKIHLIRGHSNRYFFVERERSSETDSVSVIVLKFNKREN